MIIYGSQVFAMNLVMVSITILAAISTAMYLIILVIENRVMRHRQ